MDDLNLLTRRQLLNRSATGLGLVALTAMLQNRAQAATRVRGLDRVPPLKPTAKRVIYLFQSGGPSQLETFDYKPRLTEFQGTDLPESVRMGQRLTAMSATQLAFPVVPSKYAFARHGESGAWVSELLPQTA